MSVQPGAEASTTQAQLMLATAAEYQAAQEAERRRMIAAILAIWATLDMKHVIPSWTVGGLGNRIYVLVSSLMELVAADAGGYVRQVLADQNLLYLGPAINPLNFAGIASDGRDLESLLAGAIVKVRESQRQGLSDAQAKLHGRNFLELVANTQVSDAARAAESTAITVSDAQTPTGKQVMIGWVRMLTPPSCGRCAVLAGKFYKWNSGFQRHPNCDCRHIPTTLAGANEVLTNPKVYFDSLTKDEQDYYFGKANAQAIRDGADISKVVNAQRPSAGMRTADDGHRYNISPSQKASKGTISRGGQVLRPTVWQIYRDANGDREVAKALLIRFGYALPQK